MSVPPSVFKEVEKICFNFIWNRHDKIKRNILYLNYDKGGLKMLNFKYMIYAQRVVWIKKLLGGNNDTKWKPIFQIYIQNGRRKS